ncbi:hypothetical protein M0811_12314 [Anaeramoeba ignava]|uniref:Uncharacterized protein n=1 Tax=Anaeramoeba ignava TaxID=1746090 RepID=A0A9Q0L8G5_ANAIG|nr:hypothetical protein M0811_12314 [Anaeramoeba ignava]
MGNIGNLIKIDPNFRLISICDKSHAYHNETPAILNRFEKYLLKLDEFIEFGIIRKFYEQQKEIIKKICEYSKIKKEDLIVSYHSGLFPSLAIKLQEIISKRK